MAKHEYREYGPPCGQFCERCDANMVVARVMSLYGDDTGNITSLVCWPNERYGPMAQIESVKPTFQKGNIVLDLRCPAVLEMATARLKAIEVAFMAGTIDLEDEKHKGLISASKVGDPSAWVDGSGICHFGLFGGTRSDSETGGVIRPVILTHSERVMTARSLAVPPGLNWYNFRGLFPLPDPGTRIRK